MAAARRHLRVDGFSSTVQASRVDGKSKEIPSTPWVYIGHWIEFGRPRSVRIEARPSPPSSPRDATRPLRFLPSKTKMGVVLPPLVCRGTTQEEGYPARIAERRLLRCRQWRGSFWTSTSAGRIAAMCASANLPRHLVSGVAQCVS
jgi:hypothetical protein